MYLSNKVYDVLKWVAQFLLPGLATLYFAVSGVWGLPNTEQIVGTIIAVDVFLGAILGLSTTQYKKADFELYMEDKITQGYTINPYSTATVKPTTTLSMSSKTYDILKWTTLIFLPALGTLYFALSGFWGFPYGEQIVGTVAALTAFMGVMLGVSTSQLRKANAQSG